MAGGRQEGGVVDAEVWNSLGLGECPDDAWEALKAGATTVQLYAALVYRGPAVVKQINRQLLDIMAREGVGSVGGA